MSRDEMERDALYYYDTFHGHSQFQFVQMLIQNVPTDILKLIVAAAKMDKQKKVTT